MKKVLVLLFILLLIAGCGKSNQKNKEPVKLIWYGIGGRPEDTDKVFEEVNKYLKEKINATVDYKVADWGDFIPKMQVLSASGEEYDIVFAATWAGFPQFLNNGSYLPLDDLLKNQGKDIEKLLSQDILKAARYNGKLYAIPNLKEMGEQKVFRVNNLYLKKYNLSIDGLTDLKGFFPLFEVIKNKEKNVFPFYTGKEEVASVEELDAIIEPGFPGAVKMNDKNLIIINQFKDSKDSQFLQYIYQKREAYLKGYIPKDAFTKPTTNEVRTSPTKWFVDDSDHQPGEEAIGKRLYNIDFSLAYRYKNPKLTTAAVTGSMLAISATSKNPEKAMEFINLLNTDKYLRNLINIGIEGVHYKKISENTVELLPESKKYSMPAFALGNLFLTYLYADDMPNKWDEFRKFNKAAVVSPILGFRFNPETVKNEVASIINIEAEYTPAIFSGAVDPDAKISEMLTKMDKAGLQKVLDEMQKQLDEWKKNK